MSYLCGSDNHVELAHRRTHYSHNITNPAIASHLCRTGTVGIQGTCTLVSPPSDLPVMLQTNHQPISISSGRLGPILSDVNVPPFTVSVSHPQNPDFDFIQAVRIANYHFRVVNWNPLSLDNNCCMLRNTNQVFIYGQEVDSTDLEALIGMIYQVNGTVHGSPLQIVFRSKSGIVYEAPLTA